MTKKEEIEKKQQHGRGRYQNLPKDEKQKRFEYRKLYYKMKKHLTTVIRKYFHLGNLVCSEEHGFFFRVGLGK